MSDRPPAAEGARPAPRPRRHRRVDAPPTNPEADRSDDVPAGSRARTGPPSRASSKNARDDWIEEQRPPHWD